MRKPALEQRAAEAGERGAMLGCAHDTRHLCSIGALAQLARGAKILRQAERDAGAAGDEREVAASGNDRHLVVVVDGVNHGVAPVRGESRKLVANGIGATPDHGPRNEFHAALCLPPEHANEIGVAMHPRSIVNAALEPVPC